MKNWSPNIYRRIEGRAMIIAAGLYRRYLRNVEVIAITGSCGKTTTKALLAEILAAHAPTTSTPESSNRTVSIARTLLATRARHRYCVLEIGAQGPNSLDAPLRLAAPTVGIITNIMNDHYSSFRGRSNCAEEKSKLIRSLPVGGAAVLNADDPLVAAMRSKTSARSVTYGHHREADLQIIDARSTWPDPLQGTIRAGDKMLSFRTGLFGEHWINGVMAAVAAANAVGIDLKSALARLEGIPPQPHRMQSVDVGAGITFILDDMKAPMDGMPALIKFVSQAHARRKIIVIGHLSDFPGSQSPKYRKVAHQALAAADMAIFVGQFAHYDVRGLQHEEAQGRLFAFRHLHQVNAFLQPRLRDGDLVTLKGSNKVDHMERLVMSRHESVSCWRSNCRCSWDCRQCPDRWKTIGPSMEDRGGAGH
jgi:UDP-N-acetylmuramyl pentapeptide synthase